MKKKRVTCNGSTGSINIHAYNVKAYQHKNNFQASEKKKSKSYFLFIYFHILHNSLLCYRRFNAWFQF